MTAQLPRSGVTIAAGTQIILYYDASPSGESEEMPDLSGLSYSEARDLLSRRGLYLQSWSPVSDAGRQIVGGQSIPAGTRVEHGSIVSVALLSTDESMLGRY